MHFLIPLHRGYPSISAVSLSRYSLLMSQRSLYSIMQAFQLSPPSIRHPLTIPVLALDLTNPTKANNTLRHEAGAPTASREEGCTSSTRTEIHPADPLRVSKSSRTSLERNTSLANRTHCCQGMSKIIFKRNGGKCLTKQ